MPIVLRRPALALRSKQACQRVVLRQECVPFRTKARGLGSREGWVIHEEPGEGLAAQVGDGLEPIKGRKGRACHIVVDEAAGDPHLPREGGQGVVAGLGDGRLDACCEEFSPGIGSYIHAGMVAPYSENVNRCYCSER